MRFTGLFRIFGILLMFFSLSMLPPLVIAFWYHTNDWIAFLMSFFATFSVGYVLWITFKAHKRELKTRDGFLLVVLLWTVLSLFGSIPFLLQFYPTFHFVDALFETVSGLTTTGATVINHVDNLPRALLYYRQQLHFLGGMGIVVLAVAVMPMLGVGGMQLYRAETLGPVKNNKLKPRIAETAKVLWYIYIGLVVICTLAYWLAGMSFFDAVGESYSTVATGGFSLHDASFAYYHSDLINCIAIFFMFLGGTNFSLHFYFLQRKRFSVYYKDPEFVGFFKIIFFSTFVSMIILTAMQILSKHHSFLYSLFTVVSLITTTGLTVTDFSKWPIFLPYFLMFIAMIGGCAGSTSGGIKVIRVMLLRLQGKREIKKLIHPNSVVPIKFGNTIVSTTVIESVWSFFSIFIMTFVILLLALLATGLDFTTSFGTLAATISNTGAAIGDAAANFEALNESSKWILIAAMLIGRLELFTILVLFSREYWRK